MEGSLDSSRIKAEIRRAALARRDALAPALRREYGAIVLDRILAGAEFRRARTVMAYASFGSEPDTGPLLAEALRSGKRLLLPKVNRQAGALDVFQVTDLEAGLAAGLWGIREPVPDVCALCAVEEIEFVLVPGVAFDRTGGRIGYGRGFYDRLLASCRSGSRRPIAIAAAFEAQVVEAIPMEPHDVRIDALVTEAGEARLIVK